MPIIDGEESAFAFFLLSEIQEADTADLALDHLSRLNEVWRGNLYEATRNEQVILIQNVYDKDDLRYREEISWDDFYRIMIEWRGVLESRSKVDDN